MANIEDARDFMMMRGDETEVWFTFLKTKNATTPDDQDLHEAARQAVGIFDQRRAEGETTRNLVDRLVELYNLWDWEVREGSLGEVQLDAITAELEKRHNTTGFCDAYADKTEYQYFDSVADSNESFVTAWTGEVLRLENELTGV